MIHFNIKYIVLCLYTVCRCMTLSNAQPLATTETSPSLKQWSLGIGVGMTALPSLQATYRLSTHWAVRGEYDYMGYQYQAYPLKIRNTKASVDIEARLSRFVLMAHYTPFKADWIGITAGMAVFPRKTIAGTLHLADTLYFQEAVITPEVLGTGRLRLGFATPFAPYLGVTLGRPIPLNKSSWRLDAGAYYGGHFAVKELSVDSSLFLKENEENATVLERNFNRLPVFYRLIPDVKIAWVYAL
jgi:hypothetical protein